MFSIGEKSLSAWKVSQQKKNFLIAEKFLRSRKFSLQKNVVSVRQLLQDQRYEGKSGISKFDHIKC